MIDHIDFVYAETEAKLLGPIITVAVYDENYTKQRHDQLYWCGLR